MSAKIIEVYWSKINSLGTGNDVRALILCDSINDLPTVNQFAGYTLTQGCVAECIAESKKYRMQSNGAWSEYTEGSGGGAVALPVASSSTLGGIKVGSGLSIESDGTLSATGGGGGTAGVQVEDLFDYNLTNGTYSDSTGAITADPTATTCLVTPDYISIPIGSVEFRCTTYDTNGSGYQWCAYLYDENYVYQYSITSNASMLSWARNDYTRVVKDKVSYIRFMIKNMSQSTIDVSDLAYAKAVMTL